MSGWVIDFLIYDFHRRKKFITILNGWMFKETRTDRRNSIRGKWSEERWSKWNYRRDESIEFQWMNRPQSGLLDQPKSELSLYKI